MGFLIPLFMVILQMNRIIDFLKKEIVLSVSFVLALSSMFFVPPSEKYFDYIDFRTLGLLFSLMTVMAGFNKMGVFKVIAEYLLNKVNTMRGVTLSLVLLCFFSSMIITNDVALITFVPFTIVLLKLADKQSRAIYVVTLETIAANLGSMLTPIGNPQNLYLFSAYNMNISDFFKTILPYALISLVMLVCCSLFSGKSPIVYNENREELNFDKRLITMYIALFAIALLSVFRVLNYLILLAVVIVFRVLNYLILLAVVIVFVLIFDRKVLLKVDYSLLFTFIFLFVFIGNLGNISQINGWLSSVVNGNEVPVGVLASQVFSNVPATILLSGFTNNATDLMIGVNIGGLGTLIASMASLISFKFIQKENVSIAKYFGLFTLFNVLFLAANIILWLVIK